MLRKVSRITLRKWLNKGAQGAYGIRTRVSIPDLARLLAGSGYRAWIIPIVAAGAFLLAAPADAESDRLSAVAGVRVECSPAPIPDTIVGIPGAIVYGYYSFPAQILVDGVEVGWTEPSITLAPQICRALDFTRYRKPLRTMVNRAFAWHLFAHEVSHDRGYDHGETTIGADCAAERLYMLPMMLDYGIPRWYARLLLDLERGYC